MTSLSAAMNVKVGEYYHVVIIEKGNSHNLVYEYYILVRDLVFNDKFPNEFIMIKTLCIDSNGITEWSMRKDLFLETINIFKYISEKKIITKLKLRGLI